MFYFMADARDGAAKNGCHTCCCESMSARPGETNLVEINYANWAVPIQGKGLFDGTIFEISSCLNCNENALPVIENSFIRTTLNQLVEVTITAENAVKYSILQRFSAEHGVISDFDKTTGKFTYTPNAGFTGYDTVWFTAKDAAGNSNSGQIIISVDKSAGEQNPQTDFQEPVTIKRDRVKIDRRNYLMNFALEISPGARTDDIYRLTIRQPVLDCDCNKFWHEMCIDVQIGKCG